MSDSYSDRARSVVSGATEEARRLDHPTVGTEHLLLGLLSDATGVSGEVLRNAGVTLEAARHKVAEARETAGAVAGAALPFTARAQRALERAGRFSRQERESEVSPEHVLLGVLDVEGLACQVLRGLGVDVAHLRDVIASARAGPARAVGDEEPPAEALSPRCPSCRALLDETLAERVVHARQDDDATTQVAVFYCGACGMALGVVGR